VVASEHAVFALPEPRVGLAALAGGIQRLPREIGLKRAMGLMLTGRQISAREALEWGLLNEVVTGEVVSTARKWANEIIACSPLSVRATKAAALDGLSRSIEEALVVEWELPAMKAMLRSDDAVEGPAAFAQKRTPQWKGH
jgi:enoyl-CoA hydratase/carnithine racemase